MSKQGLLQSVIANIAGPWRRPPNTWNAGELESPDPERRGRSLFRLARTKMREGDIDGALRLFDQALQALPDFADAVAVKAELLDMTGRSEEAVPYYERSRRLWAEQRAGAPDRSYVFRQHGRFTFEVEAYELALARIRTGSFPLFACGNALLAQGHPVEALLCYERAQKLRPDNPDIMAMRGEALSLQGRFKEAIEAFDQSLTALPKAPETLNGHAIAHAALGRMEVANADWRRQLELLPAHQSDARGYIGLRLADYALALPALEDATARHPDDSYLRLYRLLAARRLDPEHRTEAAAGPRDWPEALMAFHGDSLTADDVLQRADTPDRQAEAAFHFGIAALATDREVAVRHFREVVQSGRATLVEYAAARNELLRL